MHQALYRKWRPQTFEQVCGQEHITSVLSYAVQNQKVSHAYLFCGSRGTGKTTCAKILAKAINCESPVQGSPCGKCAACLAIESGATTDILEMDAASNNSVDDVRVIRDEVQYSPSLLKCRVYIIDEVHMLSASAFNALLKTLEEPPENVVFILATTELQKLPATVVSRCQRFDFRRISLPTLCERLSYIAKEEGFSLDDDAALTIARLARGGMRDAISLLELNVRPDRHITQQSVMETTGIVGRSRIAELITMIRRSDTGAIFNLISELYASSKDIAVFWQDVISFYRDMLVLHASPNSTQILDLTAAELDELKKTSEGLKQETLLYHINVLEEAYQEMQRSESSRRMIAEFALVKMTNPALDTSKEALLARIAQLEDRITMGIPAPAKIAAMTENTIADTASPPKETAANTDTTINQAQESSPIKGQLRSIGYWIEAIHKFESYDRGKAAFLSNTKAFIDTTTNRAYIYLGNKFAMTMLNTPQITEILTRILASYQPTSAVTFTLDEAPEENQYESIDDIVQRIE